MLLVILGCFSVFVFWVFWLIVIGIVAGVSSMAPTVETVLLWLGLPAGLALVCLVGWMVNSGVGEWLFRLTSPARKAIGREHKKIDPLLKQVQEDVSEKCGFSEISLHLMGIDDPLPNAFALGRCTLAVSRGLYENFSDDEIKAVLAHEMGHLHNKDSQKLGVTIGLGYFVLIFTVLSGGAYAILKGWGSSGKDGGGIFAVAALFLLPIAFLFFLFLKFGNFVFSLALLAVGRKQEFKADEFACKAGYRKGLLAFLDAIKDYDFTGNSLFAKIQRTHPAIMLRIDAIEKHIEKNKER